MSSDTSALLRYGSLLALVAQDTALVLLLRSSREDKGDAPMYLASTAVFCMEIAKLSSCALMILKLCDWNIGRWARTIKNDVFEPWGVLKLSVPGVLYLVQNNLLYFALSHLRATPYKVTYNLKILTGAFFSATMLGQRLGARKWFSLCLLMAGVSVVQLTKHEAPKEDTGTDPLHVEEALEARGQLLGFAAVFAAAVTSGFCGVYQQRILQDGGGNLWVRNAQMGLTSVIFGLGTVVLKDMEAVVHDGFFQGYTPLVWGVIFLQSFGGLNVAFILRYADNILKGFASAFSTVASCLLEVAFFGFQPSGTFLAGAVLINVAAYAYNTPGQPPKKVAEASKGKVALASKSEPDV